MKKVVIFGIGNIAENYINPDLIKKAAYCVDNSIEKQGKKFLGKEILSPDVLLEENKNNLFIIIFVQKYYLDVVEQLKGYGLSEDIHFISANKWKGNEEIPGAYYQEDWESRVSKKGGFNIFFEEYKKIWDTRVQVMSKLISMESTSVMDIGCGNMNLKNYLTKNIRYYGIDYKDRGEDTIICDFNKHEFTEQMADTFFISGCLEYVEDVVWFFDQLSKAKKEIILSYRPIDYITHLWERMSMSWKNHLSIDEIIKKIEKQGFHLAYKDEREKESYVILKFIKNDTPIHNKDESFNQALKSSSL